MGAFIIHSHGRLQECVAEEQGYYAAEGLTDYVLKHNDLGPGLQDPAFVTARGKQYGAYESYESGRDASVSCACHWTVNMAASAEHGTLWGECYFVTPAAIVVPPESPIRAPEELAEVDIHVGYHSGSHYSTIQALEVYFPPERIRLRFGGTSNERLDALVDRKAEAATVWGLQLQIVEQLGFRKIVDNSFMIAGIVAKDADLGDVRRFYRALRRAQADIDLRHQRFTHHYLKEVPERYRDLVDVRRFGPGERLVWEPYTKDAYESTHRWVEERGVFEPAKIGRGSFEDAVVLGTR